jgi:predicted HAD superfamily Cof-like phosphohydrolase
MSMMKDIADFHVKFGMEFGEHRARQLDPELVKFRTEFMKEEMLEYLQACVDQDLEGQFDALIDLTYVVLGTAYLQGFPFDEGWKRVHKANMAKVKGPSARSDKFDVIKPEGWTPPDLSDLIYTEQMELFDDNNS